MAKQRKASDPDLGFPPASFCVSFVNTGLATVPFLRRPRTPKTRRVIESYGGLVDWGFGAGGVGDDEAERLRVAAGERPEEAEAVLARALELRGFLTGLLERVLAGHAPGASDIESLNGFLSGRRLILRAAAGGDAFVWSTVGSENSLDLIPGLVAGSAVRLVVSGQLRLLRRCAGKDCQHLFLDLRNSGRRWCEGVCGGRVKGHRRNERDRAIRRRVAERRAAWYTEEDKNW